MTRRIPQARVYGKHLLSLHGDRRPVLPRGGPQNLGRNQNLGESEVRVCCHSRRPEEESRRQNGTPYYTIRPLFFFKKKLLVVSVFETNVRVLKRGQDHDGAISIYHYFFSFNKR